MSQFSAKLSIAEEIKDLVRQGKVSSRVMAYCVAGKDKQEITGLTQNKELQRIAVEESALGIPLLDGWDIIHGCRVIFPIPLAQAASWCPELVERASAIAAKETAANGVHWVFAPMLDIARDPRWGRIIEGFGEDPYLCSVMAKASIRGFQGNDLAKQGKVAACAKHYIAYGLSEGGRDYSVCDCSEHELKNVYLPPFKAAVEAGVATIMASFNEIGGEPVTGSYHLLTEILKEELGFDGFVVSDWYAIHQLINQGVAKDRKEAAYLAFNAGVDMDMVDSCYQDYIKELVEEGRISEDRLNDAVRRILTVIFRTGLFENPYPDLEADRSLKQEDLDCAKQLAQKSIVLLKIKWILPLPKKGLKIAVVGPLANAKRPLLGSWTPNNETKDVISIVEAIRTAAPEAGLITALK